MYKLLPPETREKVRSEYLLRRMVVIMVAAAGVLGVGLVGLLPSYVLSEARQREVAQETLANGAKTASSTGESIAWLQGLNLSLKVLNPKLDQEKPSLDLMKVIARKGSGVRFTNITWTVADGTTNLTLSGSAADRQALLTLQSALNGSGEFAAVSLPVSNLAKDRNLPFELKLTLKKMP